MPYRAPGWFTFPATTRVRGDDDHHRPISAAESSRRGIVVWCVEAGFFCVPDGPTSLKIHREIHNCMDHPDISVG